MFVPLSIFIRPSFYPSIHPSRKKFLSSTTTIAPVETPVSPGSWPQEIDVKNCYKLQTLPSQPFQEKELNRHHQDRDSKHHNHDQPTGEFRLSLPQALQLPSQHHNQRYNEQQNPQQNQQLIEQHQQVIQRSKKRCHIFKKSSHLADKMKNVSYFNFPS